MIRKTHVVEGFFYGLFMDQTVLRSLGVTGLDPRRAYADDYALRIGNKATLVPSPGDRAYGVIYSMTEDDVSRLYAGPGLEAYQAEAMRVTTLDGDLVEAVCYNLSVAPAPHERNAEYAGKLRAALGVWKFPTDYVDSIE